MTAKAGNTLSPAAVLPTDKSEATKAPSKIALTEKVETLAKWQIPKDQQVANPRSCVWTVLTYVIKGKYNPLHWVAYIVSIVWSGASSCWDCMCENRSPSDPIEKRKMLIQTNEDKIEALQGRISKIRKNANALQTTISSCQVTTAEGLYKWIQVLNELSELRVQGDALSVEIDALGTNTQAAWKLLKEKQAEQPSAQASSEKKPEAPPQQVDPLLKEHLLQFQEQNDECVKLSGHLKKFFDKHLELQTPKTAKNQQAAQSALKQLGEIQAKTLHDLREKAKKGPIKDRADVKGYFEYSHLFDAIKKHGILSKAQLESFSKAHGEILEAAGSLPKEWRSERPLINYGNTCWLNSTIQSIYHCPPLRAMMRRELVREYYDNNGRVVEHDTGKPVENDKTWADRSRVYKKLQDLFVAMDLGEDDKVAEALKALVDCIHETHNPEVLAPELSEGVGGQNPALTSIQNFLSIMGFKVDINVEGTKVFKDKRPSETTVRHRLEDFETCWTIDMPSRLLKKNASFVDFLEAAATEKALDITEGVLQQMKTFRTIPPVFVTCMKRMQFEALSPQVQEDAQAMMAAFAGREDIWCDDPQENWNNAVNAALALHKGKGGGASGKIETPINIQAGQQLDLSKSSLTKGLPNRESARYRLVSVADQSGSLNRGHFVAYTRQGNKWSTMSDESIKRDIPDEDMDKSVSTALIYFWVREDLLPPAALTPARAAPVAAAVAPKEKKHKGTHKSKKSSKTEGK